MTAKIHILALVALILPGLAAAQFTEFYDQTAWQAAAGPITGSEDFEGFTVDTCFGTSMALSDGISIGPGCEEPGAFGQVDVSPFVFEQNSLNGSASASINNGDGTCLQFETPIHSFGATFGSINDTELRTEIELSVSLGEVLQGKVVPSVEDVGTKRFYGVAGPQFDLLCFTFVTDDGFGLDDIEIASGMPRLSMTMAIPTLTQWAIVLMSTLILLFGGFVMRRRIS